MQNPLLSHPIQRLVQGVGLEVQALAKALNRQWAVDRTQQLDNLFLSRGSMAADGRASVGPNQVFGVETERPLLLFYIPPFDLQDSPILRLQLQHQTGIGRASDGCATAELVEGILAG